MKRRALIALVGGERRRVFLSRHARSRYRGHWLLHSGSADYQVNLMEVTAEGLKEAGYTEGQIFGIEYRWAEGRYDRLPGMVVAACSSGVSP